MGLVMATMASASSSCRRTSKVVTNAVENDSDLSQPSEIQLERVFSGCIDCKDHALILRRRSGDKFAPASVTYTDLHTKKERQGELSAYYYNHLLQLIKAQGFMDMNNQYAMGWVDSLIVKISVLVGNKRKTIQTTNEGEVPPQLWGIYMAVDGAVTHTKWHDAE